MRPIYLLIAANAILYIVGILLDSGAIFASAIFASILLMGGTLYIWRLTYPAKKASKELESSKQADKVMHNARVQTAAEEATTKSHFSHRQAETPAPNPYKSRHHHMDALRREHEQMSGEEVFRKLKRHNRRLRH